MTGHRTPKLATVAFQAATDLLLPPRCVLCDAELEEVTSRHVCHDCAAELTGDAPAACRSCGMTTATPRAINCADCRRKRYRFDRVLRIGEYTGPLRDAVLQAKHLTGEPVAAALGAMLADAVAATMHSGDLEAHPTRHFDLVTCVPAYWFRRLRRGTNSAAVLAQVVAQELNLPLGTDLLICRRSIEKQSVLSLDQRRSNVRAAFRTSWGYDIRDAKILLVDDVMTSGATAHEIAKVLRRAGAAGISVAVAARALGPDW